MYIYIYVYIYAYAHMHMEVSSIILSLFDGNTKVAALKSLSICADD